MSAPLVRRVAAAVATLATTAGLAGPAAERARAEAVSVQADVQHSGHVERGGPSLPLRRAWTARVDGGIGYPVIAEGKAFVVTTPRTADGPVVVAFSLRTGKRLWTRSVAGPADPHTAALGYEAGRLIVTLDVYYEPTQSAMLALAPADGQVLWETGDRLSLFDAAPPVVSDGVIYLSETGYGDGGISAWRAADGALLWEVSTEHGQGGAPAVAGDTVYGHVGCEPHVFRVRRDGTPLVPTSSACSSGGGGTPVLAGSRVLLFGPHGEGVFDAASGARTGALRSDYIPAHAHGVTVAPVARIPGEYWYRGHTLVARRDDGRVLWRFRGDGYLDSAPLIVGRTVFVGSGSGRLYGVDLRTGRVRARTDVGASVLGYSDVGLQTGLAADGGTLLVPARNRLVALR